MSRERPPRGRSARAPARLLALTALALAATMGAAPPAAAEPGYRVALVPAPETDAVAVAALARVKGELLAAGFDVVLVPPVGFSDPRTALETAAREYDPLAAFAIVRPGAAGHGRAAEIWVSDRLTGRTVVQRMSVDVDARRATEVLAVQAVELLRAGLARAWAAPGRPVGRVIAALPPGAAGAVSSAEARTFLGSGVGVSAGAALLVNPGGLPATGAPVLRVSLAVGRRFGARLGASGFGGSADVQTASARASVKQSLVAAESLVTFRPGRRWQPFASAGVGAQHVRATGVGSFPYVGQDVSAWSMLAVAGGGLALTLGDRVSLVADAELLVALPSATVRLDGAPVARVGRPGLLGGLGVLGVF